MALQFLLLSGWLVEIREGLLDLTGSVKHCSAACSMIPFCARALSKWRSFKRLSLLLISLVIKIRVKCLRGLRNKSPQLLPGSPMTRESTPTMISTQTRTLRTQLMEITLRRKKRRRRMKRMRRLTLTRMRGLLSRRRGQLLRNKVRHPREKVS